MEETELLALIAGGETQTVEFKERLGPSPDETADDLCALANGDSPGALIIGVADDGAVVGVGQPDRVETQLADLCRNNLEPPIKPLFEHVSVGGQVVLVATVYGRDRPYRTNRGKHLLRVGSSKRLMSREETLRLFQQSGALVYDEVVVATASLADLDREAFEAYFRQHYDPDLLNTLSWEQLLVNMRLAQTVGSEARPTIAGLLLFGDDPQRYLEYARISAVTFRGADAGEADILLSKEITGRLDRMIDEAGVFLGQNTFVTSQMNGWRREDQPQYHRDALREAVVNAVAHRDYSIRTSQIRIFAFADRIEFHSPGRLPNTVTVDSLRSGIHSSRNPALYTHLTHLGYMRRIGVGVPLMIRLSRELSGREPAFALVGEEFRVTIWARPSRTQ